MENLVRAYISQHSRCLELLLADTTLASLGDGDVVQQVIEAERRLEQQLQVRGSGRCQPGRKDGSTDKRLCRLLDGQSVDLSVISYCFSNYHLGLVVRGEGIRKAFVQFGQDSGAQRLAIDRDPEELWAWYGSRNRQTLEELAGRLVDGVMIGAVAVGEIGYGLEGWRLTNRQAIAVLPVALKRRPQFATYGESGLVAAMVNDDLLAASMKEKYLRPLERHSDGGQKARETLQAYIATSLNAASAAAYLGVSRRTVSSRLAAVCSAIGRSVDDSAAEIRAVFDYEDLDRA